MSRWRSGGFDFGALRAQLILKIITKPLVTKVAAKYTIPLAKNVKKVILSRQNGF